LNDKTTVPLAIDFEGDEPINLVCGKLVSHNLDLTRHYFIVRKLSGHASVFFFFVSPLSFENQVDIPINFIDSINCSSDCIFVGAGHSIIIFSIDHVEHQLSYQFQIDLPHRILTFFPCSYSEGIAYALTETRKFYRFSFSFQMRYDLVKFPDRVKDCLVLLARNYELFIIAKPSDFLNPERQNVPENVRNSHIPANIHRVAAKSILWEMDPGILR
jgi:hypothetical protein